MYASSHPAELLGLGLPFIQIYMSVRLRLQQHPAGVDSSPGATDRQNMDCRQSLPTQMACLSAHLQL